MNSELQRVEVEPAAFSDDQFSVEHAFLRKLLADWIEDLGEVAVEGFFVSALQKNLAAVTEDEDAKTIPFGLVDPVALCGNLVDALGKHGQDGRIDGKFHAVVRMRPQACGCDELRLLLSAGNDKVG